MTHDAALILRRPRPAKALISLVAMIDVLLILLVFFMVTSTYLDLDMIPAVDTRDQPPTTSAGSDTTPGQRLLIRVGADGRPFVRGQPIDPSALSTVLTTRLAEQPQLSVVLLPSGQAQMQALIRIMDMATQAGVTQLRVIRLEPRP